MKHLFKFIFLLLFITMLSAQATAQQMILHTENISIGLFYDGQNQILAKFSIKPDWHISWSNPGDIGKPTTVSARNSTLEIVAQSVPKSRIVYDFLHEYFYKNKAYYLLKLDNMQNTILTFDFVECNDVCKPEKLVFDVSNLVSTENDKWQNLIKNAASTFPQKIVLNSPKNKNTIFIKDIYDKQIQFVPTQKNIIDESDIQIKSTIKGTEISWVSNTSEQLKQALIMTPAKSYLVNINYTSYFSSSLFYMILLAFIGGIILNAMPCVFPILSLKIFTLVQQQNSKIKVFKNAILYTLGVFSSFMILTSILIFLKQSGSNFGWGFQLQSSWFVGIMAVLFLLLFLCMIGWIQFPDLASQRMHKLASLNEFATGFFAVLIASPCTGPFMGAAVGYAFTRGNFEIFAIFSALALGYALPYVLIELYPQVLRRIMPKPGIWMRKLQIILAIPLLLTSLWLGSVLYSQIISAENVSTELNWQPFDAEKIAALNEAKENIFVDFTADWCLTCKFNHKIILDTDRFAEFVKQNNVHLFVADITEHNPQYNAALNAYGRDSIPLYVYYHNGNYRLLPLFFSVGSLPH